MNLNLIPLVSIWGDEVSPTLEKDPLIPPPPFNDTHLNPQPDLPLMLNYSSNCLPWELNINHYLPPIDITVWCQSRPGLTSQCFMRLFPCFPAKKYFKSLTVHTYWKYVSNLMCNYVTGSLDMIPFTCNTIRVLLPVTRVHSYFIPLFEKLFNLWDTMREWLYLS